MLKKLQLTLLLLAGSAIPCFAGFPKGGLFSDAFVYAFFACIGWFILAHILGIITFIVQKEWLRITTIVLYAPLFLFPLLLFILTGSPFAIIIIPMILFFVFMIIRKRK